MAWHRHPLVLVLATLSVVAPASAHAQTFRLALRIDTPLTTTPGGLGIGHFDADGQLDVIVASPTQATVSVRRGDGRGGFGPATNYATGLGPGALAVADFNRNGRRDFAVANEAAHTVTVYLGLPLAQFGSRQDHPTGTAPKAVAVGDVDGDSKLDLVVANAGANSVSILRGTGTGSFGPKADFATAARPEHVALVDLDEDGHLDVLTANRDAISLSVLRGNGDGTFQPKTDTSAGVTPLRSLVTGDVDDDGHVDALVQDDGGMVQVFFGTGNGGFLPSNPFQAQAGTLALADLDSDGNVDLVNGSAQTGHLQAFHGNANGTFQPVPGFTSAGATIRSLSIADVNGDGGLDAVVATEALNKIAVLLAERGPVGPAISREPGRFPAGVALGRLNGDVFDDLVITCFGDDSLTVYLGTATGTVGAPSRFAAGTSPFNLVLADLDVDGDLDAAVGNDNGVVSVLPGNGAGGFGARTTYPAGTTTRDIAVGDVNQDGKPDLVTTDPDSHGIRVLLNTGSGAFGASTPYATGPGTSPSGLTLARMDADTLLDVVTANPGTNTIGILSGNGTGGFGGPAFSPAGSQPLGVTAGDVDGDGRNDIVVSIGSGTLNGIAYFGNGTGGFSDSTAVPLFGPVFDAAIADLNRDGWNDLAFVATGGHFYLLLGDGTGHFGAVQSNDMGFDAGGLAVGDFDANGRSDLAVTSSDPEAMDLHLGLAPTRTALAASPNPVAYGNLLTLTATVTVPPPPLGPPTGVVRFHDGSTLLGAAVLVNGVATLPLPAAFPWFRTYRATYAGDDRRHGSVSEPLEVMTYVETVGVPAPTPGPGEALELALEGVRPNPAPAGRLRVHFTLPTDAPARLELFDVRGRRVMEQGVEGVGAGFRSVALEADRPVPPGVYLVRLTQAGIVRHARAVVTD
jgi:hypothetical protein